MRPWNASTADTETSINYGDFIGDVQHRLELATQGEAVRATRAVLTALGERLGPGEASDLAGPLPMEIDRFLIEADSGQQFGYQAFLRRVAAGANVEESDALFYAQAVIALVAECCPESEVQQARDQLPDEFEPLFELVDAKGVPW